MPDVEGESTRCIRVASREEFDEPIVAFDRTARVATETLVLRSPHHRVEVVDDRSESVVAESSDGYRVQFLVGRMRCVDVALLYGQCKTTVGVAHQIEVLLGQSTGYLVGGERVHRADDIARLAGGPGVDRGDGRRAAGDRHDEPARRKSQEGLADGRAAHSEPLGELGILQLLAGGEGAVDDGVTEAPVDVVAEE